MYSQNQRFPWQYWVKLAYNDALTFNHSTQQGGVKASWRFRQIARAPVNRDMQAFAVYLQHLKDNENIAFDKLSYADYTVAAAFTAI